MRTRFDIKIKKDQILRNEIEKKIIKKNSKQIKSYQKNEDYY